MKHFFYICCILLFVSCFKKKETCTDHKQNQNETKIDCGGICTACPTCTDGVKNQDETGIDCGGSSCSVCPTCDDGIKNGNETGIDCGGSSCVPCQINCMGADSVRSTALAGGKSGIYSSLYTLSGFDECELRVNFPLNSKYNVLVFRFQSINNLMKQPVGTTQQFTTQYYWEFGSMAANDCFVYGTMEYLPQYDMPAYADQHVFLTKIASNKIQVKCCNLSMHIDDNVCNPLTGPHSATLSANVNSNYQP